MQEYNLGMVGLGTMGCNLVMNIVDQGFSVAGYDRDRAMVQRLQEEAKDKKIFATQELKDFIAALELPRVILMLVPAGAPVDAVIRDLLGYITPNDILVDAGNSHYCDTKLRQMTLAQNRVHLLGVGISGGAEGARHGASLMPGGAREAYDRVQPILEATAARFNNVPCVAYLGPGPAGHYVKMVHNGIEYGLMRLIAETYGFMKRGLGLNNDELHAVYREWNESELRSFLIEITAQIFLQVDETTGQRLIDLILPVARQKGTRMWTSQDAMELQVPTPTIDMAVAMRNMSTLESDRLAASPILHGPSEQFNGDRKVFLGQLRQALQTAFLLTYAQGFMLLRAASYEHGYGFNLETVARIWRAGCIIRSALLEKLVPRFAENPEMPSLLLDPEIAQTLSDGQGALRQVVATGVELGVPLPAFMATLGFYDTYRSSRMTSNLIQAQRDYFGAHTYERIDAKGVFHTKWTPEPD